MQLYLDVSWLPQVIIVRWRILWSLRCHAAFRPSYLLWTLILTWFRAWRGIDDPRIRNSTVDTQTCNPRCV